MNLNEMVAYWRKTAEDLERKVIILTEQNRKLQEQERDRISKGAESARHHMRQKDLIRRLYKQLEAAGIEPDAGDQ